MNAATTNRHPNDVRGMDTRLSAAHTAAAGLLFHERSANATRSLDCARHAEAGGGDFDAQRNSVRGESLEELVPLTGN